MRYSVSKIYMFFLIMLMFIQPVQAKIVDKPIDNKFVCTDATMKFEKKYEIKEHLLSTISNVETGKWDEALQRRTTWPWTINANGKGMYFDSKEDAIKKVKELQDSGVKSIDVGCMQINLSYHGEAFESLEEAFDPDKNVEYGAKFLKRLYSKTDNDWMKAATNYHSKLPKKAKKYGNKLNLVYEEVKLSLSSDLFEGVIEQPKKKVAKKTIKERISSKLTNKRNSKDMATKANEWREARLEEYRKNKTK